MVGRNLALGIGGAVCGLQKRLERLSAGAANSICRLCGLATANGQRRGTGTTTEALDRAAPWRASGFESSLRSPPAFTAGVSRCTAFAPIICSPKCKSSCPGPARKSYSVHGAAWSLSSAARALYRTVRCPSAMRHGEPGEARDARACGPDDEPGGPQNHSCQQSESHRSTGASEGSLVL